MTSDVDKALEELRLAFKDYKEDLDAKVRLLLIERAMYKRDSPYNLFLGGVIQGINFAKSHPSGAISMTETVTKSMENDLRENVEKCPNCGFLKYKDKQCPYCLYGRGE